MRTFLFVLVLGWLLLGAAHGPAAGQALRFQRFTTQHGLANNAVSYLAQDERGFLWVSTGEGLSRFDGVEFRNFFHQRGRAHSLPGNKLTGLARAPGGMWVCTSLGLARYDARTDSFRPRRFRVPGVSDAVTNTMGQVIRRRNGETWVANGRETWRLDAHGRELARYHGDTAARGQQPPGYVGLTRACEDAQGRLWLPTGAGLCCFDPATNSFLSRRFNPHHWRALDIGRKAPGNVFSSLAVDHRGRIWIGMWGDGLYCFDPATNALRHWMGDPTTPGALPNAIITSLLEDRAGRIWIGTYLAGLARYDEVTGTFAHFAPDPADPYSLPHHQITDLFEDRQGNVWVGTLEGLALVSPLATRFESWTPDAAALTPAHAPTPPDLSAVLEDRTGAVWVGTYGHGLLRFEAATGKFRRLAVPPSSGLGPGAFDERNLIWELAEDRDGLLWVATQTGALRFDPRREAWLPLPPVPPRLGFLENSVIGTAWLDRAGDVWLASFHKGLTRYRPATGEWQAFSAPVAPPDRPDTLLRAVMGLAQDRAGRYWLAGVRSQGLTRLPAHGAGRATVLPPDGRAAPADNELTDVFIDSADGVWLAASRTGLHYRAAHTGGWQSFDREDGLGGNFAWSITADRHGHLWIGTEGGLTVLEPRAGRIRTFTQADGLPESLITKAHLSTRTGDLWLIGAHHLLRVRPDELPVNREAPPLAFTRFEVNGRARPLPTAGETIELQPGQTALSFDFAALNLLAPSANRYSWMLEGADETWTPSSTRRSVTYAGLAPGAYTFRVRAANNDGVWNRRGLIVGLTLLPPWYATWFRALLVLAGATILYTFYRLRLARVLALQGARNQIARDLHDDVGSTLSSILIQSRMPPNPARSEERLHKIGDSSQRMLEALHDIVWAVNPDHDPLPSVIARMRAFAAQTLEARGITLDFQVEGKPETVLLRLSRRRDFYLIFKEVIANTAKYADATRVQVRLNAQTNRLHLEVSDDGQGFDPEAPARGSGNGLRNLRQRAGALGGTFSLESALGAGTRLDLAFRPG